MRRFLPLLVVLAGCGPKGAVAPPEKPQAEKPAVETPVAYKGKAAADNEKPAADNAPADKPAAVKAATTDRSMTWSDWRGPAQNGWSPERDLPSKFVLNKKDPDYNLVWSAPTAASPAPSSRTAASTSSTTAARARAFRSASSASTRRTATSSASRK